MSILSADDMTQAEHYTKETLVKRWLILMLYINSVQFDVYNVQNTPESDVVTVEASKKPPEVRWEVRKHGVTVDGSHLYSSITNAHCTLYSSKAMCTLYSPALHTAK